MRPIIFITVGYITGIIWGLYFKKSIALISFLILIGIVIIKKMNIKKIEKYKIHIFLFIIFSIISNIRIMQLENKFENLYNGVSEAEIIGTIITNGEESEYKRIYILKVENINNSKRYKNTNLIIYTPKNIEFEYGDLVKVNGTYENASIRTNYKAFDYREYLKQKNVYGIVKLSEKNLVLKKDNLNPILIFFNKVKTKIKDNLKYLLEEEFSLANGILLRRCF